MQLRENEVKVIASMRAKKRRDINWSMRYVIPTFASLAVAMLFIILSMMEGYENLLYIGSAFCFIALGIWVLWYYRKKKPFVKNFVVHYNETGELLEV